MKRLPGKPFGLLRIWRCGAPLLSLGTPHAASGPIPREIFHKLRTKRLDFIYIYILSI